MPDNLAPDTSSYPRPGPPVNPLDQIMKTGQAADVMGNIAVGQGMQQAIQPDGTIDKNVLAQVLKGSVAGSMKAPQALNALETLRQAGYAADTEGINAIRHQRAYSASLLAPFMARETKENPNPEVSQEEMMSLWGKMIKHGSDYGIKGIIPMAAASLPVTANMTGQQRFQALKNHYLQGQDIDRQFEALLPKTQGVQTGAVGGEVPAGSRLNPRPSTYPMQPGPTAPTIGPNGEPLAIGAAGSGAIPGLATTDKYGRPIAPSVMPPPSGVGPRPPRSQNMTDTNAQVLDTNGKPVRLAQPGDGTTYRGQGPYPTGLAPGQTEPLTASGAAYAKDLTDSREYSQRMNPLKQAIPLLEKGASTGPGSETVQHIKAFAQTFGIPVPNAENVTKTAEAKKYLSQNAAAIAPPGTNIPSVLNAFEANPNMQQPKQAAVELSKMLYALGRMKQASILAFNRDGPKLPNGQPNSAQYANWASTWSPQQDVRGYMADLMTPEGRKDLLSKVNPGSPAAAKIKASYQTAKSLGLLGDVEGH